MNNLNLALIKGLILDLDGVLWRANQPIGDLPAIFNKIQDRGWQVILATNNATRTVEQYIERMHNYGVSILPWQIVHSGMAAAHYLLRKFPGGGPVYILGEQGVTQALHECGFYPSEDNPIAVIAGMDRGLSYEKLRRASLFIRQGLPFIATNGDRTFPTPEGLVPGAGAILAALESATYISPYIAGKPAPEMYRLALERLGTKVSETLVVGDRPETDIAGAQVLGCRSALVLSGVVNLEEANRWQPKPDLIIKDLATIVETE
jgi:4-nitrophenyl phosphatase